MSLNQKIFVHATPPRSDNRGYPIDYYGRAAILSEEPIDADTGRPIGPPLRRCLNPSCYGCLLWAWDGVRSGQPGGTVCGYCGNTERVNAPDAPELITSELAETAKRRFKLRLGGAETAAEKEAAETVLREVGEALVVAIEEGRRSLDRSYEKQYLLNFAIWESMGLHWRYAPGMTATKRAEYEAKRRSVNEDMYSTNWEPVIAEIVAKITEIKKMRKILEEIKHLGV